MHSGTLVGKQSAAIGGGNGQNRAVLAMLVAFLGSLCSLARTRGDLTLENLALRQQLVVLRRVRPKRHPPDPGYVEYLAAKLNPFASKKSALLGER